MERRGEAADRRGESFGAAAGVGDGAPAWDFQSAPFLLAQGVPRGAPCDVAGLVPAVVVPEPPETASGAAGGRIEIIIANGRRVIVNGDVDPTQSQRRPRAKTLCPNNCYSESSPSLENIVTQIKKKQRTTLRERIMSEMTANKIVVPL